MLAELERRTAGVPRQPQRQPRVLQRHGEPLRRVRVAPPGPPRQEIAPLGEDPRVPERAARDHDAGAARVPPHRDDVLGRPNVPVPDQGTVEPLHQRGDLIPISGAGEHLRAGARVQRDRLSAGLTAAQRDRERVALRVIPAAADLHRNGQVGPPAYGTDDRLHLPQVLQAPGAAVVLHHLLHGTAEVDVDEVRLADLGHHLGGPRHDRGVGAIELDPDRALGVLEAHVREQRGDPPRHPYGGDELRHHDVRPEAAAQQPEGRLRHAGHRGQEERYVGRDAGGELHAQQRNGAVHWEQPVITLWRPIREERRPVQLREFFSEDAVNLQLTSTTKDEVLKELIGLLKLDDKADATLYKMLRRRATPGRTATAQGIALPHCRSLVVNRLRVAFGRKLEGIDFKAIDDRPVHYFFLIVSPPLEVSNQYLPVLGKIAQFAKEPDVPDRLAKLATSQQFLKQIGRAHV